MKKKKILLFAILLIVIGGIISVTAFTIYGNNEMGIYRANGKWDYFKPVSATESGNIITETVLIPDNIEEMYIDISFFDLQFVESDDYKIEYSFNDEFSSAELVQTDDILMFRSENKENSIFSVGIGNQVNIGYSSYNRYEDNKITVYIDSNRKFEMFNIISKHLNGVANVSNINSTNLDFDIAYDDYIFRNIKANNANLNFQHSVVDIYDTDINALHLIKAYTTTRIFNTDIDVLNNEMRYGNFAIEGSSVDDAFVNSKYTNSIFYNTNVGKFSLLSMEHSELDYTGDMINQMDLDMSYSNMDINMKNTSSDKYSFNFSKNFSDILVDGSDLYTIFDGENKISGNLNHSNINIYFN